VDNRHVAGDVLRRIAIRFYLRRPIAGVAVECISASSAIMQAETLLMAKAMRALLHSAAQAIRRGEKDATVLKKFGDVRTI
jgi:hypothetical protein